MSITSIYSSGLFARMQALISPEFDDVFESEPEIARILKTMTPDLCGYNIYRSI